MSDHAWRPFPVTAVGIPSLLVSTSFTSQSYTIHVTDLVNVWSETMSKSDIFRRAFKDEISIDLSDGDDQLDGLLKLLGAAFDPDRSEHANTSLSLSARSNNSNGSLVINITCALPKPLEPLEWSMHLSKSPTSAIASDLILPLIRAQQVQGQEIQALLATIRDKDSVIDKLADKVDANIGLEHVFTSLTGKRKVTRAIAEARTRGLAPFSEDEFRREVREDQGSRSSDVPALLDSVFGGKGLPHDAVDEADVKKLGLDGWWLKLRGGAPVGLADRGKSKATSAAASSPPKKSKAKASDDNDDDDFQVQATPPHLAKSRERGKHHLRSPVKDDDETASSDGGSPVPGSSKSAPKEGPRPTGSRLGAIGKGRRPRSPEPAPVAPPVDDDETTSEDEDPMDVTASSPHRPPSPSPAKSRLGGLGRIGGKRKTRSPSPLARPAEDSPLPSSRGALAASTPPPSRRRLGAIGKRPADDLPPSTPDDDDATMSSPPSAPPSRTRRLGAIGKRQAEDVETAPSSGTLEQESQTGKEDPAPPVPKPSKVKPEEPEETPEERMIRRRAELQKTLQGKTATAPVKKKRKF